MKNKKSLVASSLLRKIIEVFASFFLNIYLFKLVDGDFNFLLLYATFNAVSGCILGFFLMKYINSKTANLIFRSSYICEVISILMLLFFKENLINVIWIFALVSRYAKSSYYAVYEVTLIKSTKNDSLSSYVAGVGILGSIISLLAPALMGFLITDYSYTIVFVLMLIDAIIAVVVASVVDFKVIDNTFELKKYWRKALKNKNMRLAYLTTFLKRLAGTDGVLDYLLPVLLFMTLGTEFSVGSWGSLFSVVYMILLEVVRVLNKQGKVKKFYVPLALLCLTSAIVMMADFNTVTILLFYFTIKTGGGLIATESASMLYAIGNKEKLGKYTREHQFTWNVSLSLGNLVGIGLAYFIYNNFYNPEVFAVIIVVLMMLLVLQSYLLQKVEGRLGNA